MRTSLLALLRCPAGCETEMALSPGRQSGDNVWSGALGCPECGASYAIEKGIPDLLPADLAGAAAALSPAATDDGPLTGSEWKLSEARARDAQARHYDRMWMLKAFGAFEVPLTLRALNPRPGDTLLEAGCGTGRMTRTFAGRCERVVAADFSRESLRRNAAKLRAAGVRNVDLIRADVCRLPLRPEAFDRVVSCQVLEHVPTPEAREDAVRELARVLRPDGTLVLSAYRHSFLMRFFDRKEGAHAGGIYYYRFDRPELQELLSRHARVLGVSGALVHCHVARCRREAPTPP